MNLRPRLNAHAPLAVAAVFLASSLGLGARSVAATSPHLVITHEVLKDPTGRCTIDRERATAAGVPADVANRIDGILANAVTTDPDATSTAAEWKSKCAAAAAQEPASYKSAGRAFSRGILVKWSPGWQRGRWISVRLRVSDFETGAAHPSEQYYSYTFDLTHGGYPVPTSGFYLTSQRHALGVALGNAEAAFIKADYDRLSPGDRAGEDIGAELSLVRSEDLQVPLEATNMMLTTSGVEFSGFGTSGADTNVIVTVPFSALSGVGTPGGPLDPSTR